MHVEAERHDIDGLVDGAAGRREVAVIVSLLTDYGHDDEFAGVCHGVILSIDPEATIVDVTHGIGRYDVRHGAIVLRNVLPYLPVGVHVAVVDPQVGTERRAVALRTGDGRMLVGPDNGLLSLAWERCGGVSPGGGRDPLAAPARAGVGHLPRARPVRPGGGPARRRRRAGGRRAIRSSPDELERLELPQPRDEDGTLVAHALLRDRFGNVALDVDHERPPGQRPARWAENVEVEVGDRRRLATYAHTFADVPPGELLVYEDAYRTLALAVNRGDAAAMLGVEPDAEVRLRPR